MPVIILTDDTLHVQPLHPAHDPVVGLFAELGAGFHADASRLRIDVDPPLRGAVQMGLPVRTSSVETDDLLRLVRFRFPLRDIRRVVVAETFPGLSIEIRGPSIYRETYDLTPRFSPVAAGATPEALRGFSRAIEALFAKALAETWEGEWVPGWLDLPAVEWERVTEFPSEVEQPPGYRTTTQTRNRIVAERGPGPTFERLARALLPGGHRSPRKVVLTRADIYAEFADGIHRLPRGLPCRHSGRAMVFGRFAAMVLEPRPGACPVERALREGEG